MPQTSSRAAPCGSAPAPRRSQTPQSSDCAAGRRRCRAVPAHQSGSPANSRMLRRGPESAPHHFRPFGQLRAGAPVFLFLLPRSLTRAGFQSRAGPPPPKEPATRRPGLMPAAAGRKTAFPRQPDRRAPNRLPPFAFGCPAGRFCDTRQRRISDAALLRGAARLFDGSFPLPVLCPTPRFAGMLRPSPVRLLRTLPSAEPCSRTGVRRVGAQVPNG